MFQQQGDVIIKSSRIPKSAKPINSNILAEGEATGHAHRVTGGDCQLLEEGQKIFMRILSGDCSVTHEEHADQAIAPGEYEIRQVLEYDHVAEEARAVRD